MKKFDFKKFIFFLINWFIVFVLILMLQVVTSKYELMNSFETDAFAYGGVFVIVIVLLILVAKNIYIKTSKNKIVAKNNNITKA